MNKWLSSHWNITYSQLYTSSQAPGIFTSCFYWVEIVHVIEGRERVLHKISAEQVLLVYDLLWSVRASWENIKKSMSIKSVIMMIHLTSFSQLHPESTDFHMYIRSSLHQNPLSSFLSCQQAWFCNSWSKVNIFMMGTACYLGFWQMQLKCR